MEKMPFAAQTLLGIKEKIRATGDSNGRLVGFVDLYILRGIYGN